MNPLPLLYRLEHKHTREGVYANTDSREVIDRWLNGKSLSSTPLHPGPCSDSLLQENFRKTYPTEEFYPWNFLYGFKDIEQMRRWFFDTTVLEDLFCVNIVFNVYKVQEIIVGRTQAIVSCDSRSYWKLEFTITDYYMN